ncbi:MAG: ATP-binding protein [Orrella sp.]
MNLTRLTPRFSHRLLSEALEDSPVVLIHGPRQCGKSTLARMLGDSMGYDYMTFDNDVTRDFALNDPLGFVDSLPERIILDEVQRVPQLFTSFKAVVDKDRQPGRFLLTGSANILLLPKLADSLAGRMAIQRLYPFAQCELEGQASDFLDRLFTADFPMRQVDRLKDNLLERIVSGGYPPALSRPEGRRRDVWYRDYLDTVVQRDVREISHIRALDALPRLLQMTAVRTAQLLNLTELASAFQLSRPTIGEYLTLLENIFLVERLPPWHSNQTSRLVKTPKLHMGDTGLACSLLGLTTDVLKHERDRLGPLLETFVYQELRRLASWHDRRHDFFHYRDKDQVEVDIVIDRGIAELAGVEVKAAATVKATDFKGLQRLQKLAGERFAAGVVLYDGEICIRFAEKLFAVPLRWLWDRP